jgi:hypothetical protein
MAVYHIAAELLCKMNRCVRELVLKVCDSNVLLIKSANKIVGNKVLLTVSDLES